MTLFPFVNVHPLSFLLSVKNHMTSKVSKHINGIVRLALLTSLQSSFKLVLRITNHARGLHVT